MQDTLKSERGIVIVDHRGQLILVNTGFLEAVVRGVIRKAAIVLDTGKAFFLCCCNDLAVLDQSRGRVVIEAGKPENEGRLPNGRTIPPLLRSYFGRTRQQPAFLDFLFEETGYLLVTKWRKVSVALET